jgi:hypothetical protein
VYAKIFTSIFDGSMRGHPDLILVFINMLCHASEDGIVDRHWRAISDETGIPTDRVRLQRPEEGLSDCRNTENGGGALLIMHTTGTCEQQSRDENTCVSICRRGVLTRVNKMLAR